MGLGQTFLTIASIALLGLISLTLNTSYLNANQVMYESEFDIEAISLAESYLERAVGKAYDDQTVQYAVTSPTTLTTNLGPESGETNITKFDDFDDFNGYSAVDTVKHGSLSNLYNVSIQVGYVADTDLGQFTTTKGWHKKMIITVNNSYMTTPIKMSYVFSYF